MKTFNLLVVIDTDACEETAAISTSVMKFDDEYEAEAAREALLNEAKETAYSIEVLRAYKLT